MSLNENAEDIDLEEIRDIASQEAQRVAELGGWPEGIDVQKSITARIPEGEKMAPGFDAGLASALDMIPRDKQKLSAILHAAYTPEAIKKVLEECSNQDLDPDSETTWWLAACSICKENYVDPETFKQQIKEFDELTADPEKRVEAAKKRI